MPATEKTWRDQAGMHIIFGVSALVMLVSTVWMLAKDHNREWRRWQLDDRAKDHWQIEAQLAQAEAESMSDLNELRSELHEARSSRVDDELVERFKARIEREDEELAEAEVTERRVDFTRINRAQERLNKAEEGSEEARAARAELLNAMAVETREARRREDALVSRRKFKAADHTAAVSERGIAVGEGRSTARIDERIRDLADEIEDLDEAAGLAKDYRVDLEQIVREIRAEELQTERQIASIVADLDRLRTQINRDVGPVVRGLRTVGETINRGPVLDAMYTGDIQLEQIWLPDMTINYNFSHVARYDRCTVCHQAIDKTAPGSAIEPAYPAVPADQREQLLTMATPEAPTLEAWYGITLTEQAVEVNGEDADAVPAIVVDEVAPTSRAGVAGLASGDVVLTVNGLPIASIGDVEQHLLQPTRWDRPITLLIRRGPRREHVVELGKPMEAVYGLRLARRGQIEADDVTVQVVFPKSRAAVAGLQTGDVIRTINRGGINSEREVNHYLLEIADWGRPLELRIGRGLPQPFTSHPRLDLFVGPTSPHTKGDMGCTICHDGQGSATEFKWASHTPNDAQQALVWSREHGWFDNHHWIFPMTPARFIESNCLKCHHEVAELEPSERFPEPPAPKLVKGYHLVREFGCFGCHEIPGYDGPKRIGPDMRVEPNFSAVAAQLLTDPGLNDEERTLASRLIERPENNSVRHELLRAINADARNGKNGDDEEPRLTPASHALADALRDVDVPGDLRKVGPSLRHLGSKVDFDWLYNWIRRPADFRPDTRMPQFFLQHEHLDNKEKVFEIRDADGNKQMVTDRQYTERFEDIEIRAIAEYLLAHSQPFEYLDQPADVTEAPSAERGRWLFESRGCLACHAHEEFPGIHSTHGPDLSRVAAKFDSEKGQRWLYSWLREPNRYHPRTVMPDVFLEPIVETDSAGNPTGRVTDPTADIIAFLLGVDPAWQPEVATPSRELSPEEQAALNDLTAEWLSASFPRRRAVEYARNGIPERLSGTVKVDERVLLGMTPEDRTQRQMEFVARRALSHYGCFGCHDIPGYETATPIGTPLAGWGRKDPAQIAFENIGKFLATHGLDVETGVPPVASESAGEPHAATDHGGGHHGLDPLDDQYDSDTAYYLQALNSHHRQGFIWQKLRMPRSYDYETTRHKRYDERLRMPRFPLDDEEREAIITFVLGLTNEAPHTRYIYQPDRRQEAIVQGRHVLHKYNCAGCHVLDMERWEIAFDPGTFGDPSPPTMAPFPFLVPQVTEEQLAESLTTDRRGLLHATLHGMPMRDEETGEPLLVDEDGLPWDRYDVETNPHFVFQLYADAVIEGGVWPVGEESPQIAAARDGSGPARGTRYPAQGGDLANYLYPRVIERERTVNPAVVPTEAWGWLPPPLHHQGTKVQTDWLHDFLMDPTRIRPAAVMRMPHFHMSSDDAAKLVDYFAAISNAEFPYEYNPRRRGGYLARLERAHPELLDDAMRIVTDGNYCVKCHSVGDYQVQGAVATLGPDLDEVYRRLRPDYVRRWLARPASILPYTGMPVNIPFDPDAPHHGGVSQKLFPGSSVQQLDGVVDLLMNFDEYAKRQTSIRGLVREAPPETEPAASTETTDRAASESGGGG